MRAKPQPRHVDHPATSASLLRALFLGFVKIHVLHHASREPIYGIAIRDELSRHGYVVSPGILYPLLHNLEASTYLEREDRLVEGKRRKYYRITTLGLTVLAQARTTIRELVDEVLES